MKPDAATRPARGGILLAAVVLTGCGSGLVPVSGTVTLDGEPVAGAKVSYIPTGPGIPASGTTDAAGRFQLELGSGRRGVPRGRYAVTIVKLAVTTVPANEARRLVAAAPGAGLQTETGPDGLVQVIEHVLPGRYADPATSGIEADVPAAGEQQFALGKDP